MSLRKRRNLVLLAVIHLLVLAAFLPGCKEGTKTTPVSAILTSGTQGTAITDSEDAIHTIAGVVSSQATSSSVEGIEVSLFLNKQLIAKTLSTTDGQFYFAKVPPGLYEITFASTKAIADFATSTSILRVLEDGTTQPSAPSVKLTPTNQERLKVQAKLQGEVVLSSDGTKLANINVDLVDKDNFIITSGLTNSLGYFAFEGIGTGTYTIKAGKASIYTEQPQPVTVRDDGVVSPLYSVISLTPTPVQAKFNIIGTVISQFNSEKLANATAALYLDNVLKEKTRTTTDGQFYFAQLAAGLYEIRFSLPEYKDSSLFVRILDDGKMSPEAPIAKMEPVNPTAMKIEGKIEGEIVLYSVGTKLANINVELFNELGQSVSTALTNGQGYFSFDKLGTGTYHIIAGKSSIYDLDDKTFVTIRDDGIISPRYSVIALKVSPVEVTYTIQGTVISQNTSEKLANVTVTLYLNGNPAGTSKTTSDGLFYFSNLSKGLYDVVCMTTDDSYYPATIFVRILDNGTLSPESPIVKLVSKNPQSNVIEAKIEGEVSLYSSGAKLANINVELKDSDEKLVATVLSNSQGSFSFENVKPGNYKVYAGKASLYKEISESINIYNDGIVSPRYIRMALTPSITSYSIVGFVRNQSNCGLPYLKVNLYKTPELSDAPKTTRTTGEGKFYFEDLIDPGMYYLEAEAGPDTDKSTPYPVRILSDNTTSPASILISVTRAETIELASISGTIYDAFTGGYVEYASIKVNGNDNGVTDKNGRFIIPDLTVGNYKIEVSKFGYETLNVSFELKPGRVTIPSKLNYPLLHNMKSGYGSIAGRFVDETKPNFSGKPNQFVRLYKWGQVTKNYKLLNPNNIFQIIDVIDWELLSDEPVLSTKTGITDPNQEMDMSGAFKLTHLEPGYYVVYITASSTLPLTHYVSRATIPEDTTTWRELDIDKDDPDFGAELRQVKVEDGKTTYWTNFEQPFDGN